LLLVVESCDDIKYVTIKTKYGIEQSVVCFLAELRNRYTNAIIQKDHDQLMDNTEFQSAMFQRPFQYLRRFALRKELRGVQANTAHGTPEECITTLLQ